MRLQIEKSVSQIKESESNQFAATASLIQGLVSHCMHSTECPGRPLVTKMVVKEEISLLPSSVKGATGVKERRMSIKRSFHWLQIATLTLIIGWLALLSVRSWQPVLSEEVVNKLMRVEEVRDCFLY